MKKQNNLTATRLRLILSISLFVITLAGGVIFSFINGQLKTYAVEVSHKVIDANASRDTVQTLQRIQQELNNDKDIIARTNSIVADSQSYQYQDQIVGDLNNYASAAGIVITNMDFSTNTTAGATNTTTPPTNKAAAPAGVKSVSVSVTLKNPIGYDNFLRFVRSIENNLTKMQIQKITLSKGTAGNDISSDVLTIQVYTK
jgi:hypothetical protein